MLQNVSNYLKFPKKSQYCYAVKSSYYAVLCLTAVRLRQTSWWFSQFSLFRLRLDKLIGTNTILGCLCTDSAQITTSQDLLRHLKSFANRKLRKRTSSQAAIKASQVETCRIFFLEICSHIMKQACLPCLPNTVQTCSDSLRRNKQKFIKVFWLQLTLLTFLRSTVCCWSGWPSEVSHSNGAKAPATRDKDVDEEWWRWMND